MGRRVFKHSRNELYDVVCSAVNLENLDVSGIQKRVWGQFPTIARCQSSIIL